MEIRINIEIEKWPITRLIPRISNPRTHTPEQVAQIAASIREFGWTNPVLVGADTARAPPLALRSAFASAGCSGCGGSGTPSP
jgi:hypothetical protein